MAYNKLHKKDFTIAVKTGGNANDQLKFKKEASKGELFFNTYDKKLYCATTDAGSNDAILYETSAFSLTPDPNTWSGNTYSISLDGVSDYASFTQTDFATGARSFSFWYKWSSINNAILPFIGGTYQGLIGQNASNGYFYAKSTNGNTKYALQPTSRDTTTWHNLIWTQSAGGTDSRIYFDGSSLSVSGPAEPTTMTFNSIGKSIQASTVYFPGKIDEVAYFDYTLSSSQVTNIYKGEDDGGSGGTNGTAGDLTSFAPEHWWRMGDFENGTGSSVKDQGSASSTLDLTLNGASFASDAP